jgi:hypothetical protein
MGGKLRTCNHSMFGGMHLLLMLLDQDYMKRMASFDSLSEKQKYQYWA